MPKVARPTKPLAVVNVYGKQTNGACEVEVCFLPDPDIIVGEGNSKAFLALDASASMKPMYGDPGPFPGLRPNYVQAVARKIGSILCSVSKTGTVGAAYWALHFPGDRTEWVGELDEAAWENANIVGPKTEKWGRGTRLLPALRIAVEEVHRDSDWSMAVFIKDGLIEDEQDCMDYCTQLGKAVDAGTSKPIKFVLIGVGSEVDEDQLERFDDMFEKTDLEGKIDLWSTSPVSSIQDESDILAVLYGELMTEDMIVASSGRVESGSGQELQTSPSCNDGMPGKVRFFLPPGEKLFRIHVAGQTIEQDCAEVVSRV